MRRRPSSALGRAACLALLLAATPAVGWTQSQLAEEGAIFLLLPVGARAVGMGQAVVADASGSEAVWWNPAGLARLDKREIAIHHSQSISGTGDNVSLVIPSSLLGVITASIGILDEGEEPNVDPQQGSLGTFTPRSLVYAATYASPVGQRLNAGVTFKVVQSNCAGSCPAALAVSASTSALDFGAQYDLAGWLPLSLGAAVRNLGPRLQVNDREQSDPLPTRVQLGFLLRVPDVQRFAENTEVHVTGDVIAKNPFAQPALRFGGDLIFHSTMHLRTGYVFETSSTSGAALGFGIVSGGLVIDLARTFQGFSVDAGQAPTYLSLRYLF